MAVHSVQFPPASINETQVNESSHLANSVEKATNSARAGAFAYLRVSGKGQIDGDGFPRQAAAITKHAKAHGLTVSRVFREEGIRHQLVEPGSLRLGTADFVCVFLDDLVTTLLGQLAQVVKLRLRVLVEGGDAEVEGRALH